ncbi:MAG: hypothetical protein KBE65_13155 [Phycisphaerae bacterium]|nr:hypothetical protein [Phycisphaerae bacterium]
MRFTTGILVGLCVVGLVGILPPRDAGGGGGDPDGLVGEQLWSFSNTIEGTPISGTLRLGVMKVVDDHYLCSGVLAITDPEDLTFSLFGNMERMNNEIRATLCLQGKRCEGDSCTVGIDMMTITMDPNALDGTLEGVGFYRGATESSVGEVVYVGRALSGDDAP